MKYISIMGQKNKEGDCATEERISIQRLQQSFEFFLTTPIKAIINPLPLASVQRVFLNEIIHHKISWLFFSCHPYTALPQETHFRWKLSNLYWLATPSQANTPYICADGSMLPLASPALLTHKIRRRRWSRGTLGRWQVPDQHVGPLQRQTLMASTQHDCSLLEGASLS